MTAMKPSNRLVCAAVRIPEGTSAHLAEAAFQEKGWHFQPQDDGYVVAIPLYCARIVALQEADSELTTFSRRHAPLVVDELRVLEPVPDQRRRMYVARAAGGWVGLMPYRLRRSREAHPGPKTWAVAVERGNHDLSPWRRRAGQTKRASEALRASALPGDAYDPREMVITSMAEPRVTHAGTFAMTWPHLRSLVGIVLAILGSLVGAVVAWSDSPTAARVVGGVVAAVIVVLFTLWVTGDRLSVWVRIWWVVLGLLATFYLGLVFSDFPKEWPFVGGLGVLIVVAVALIVAATGWTHLINRHPAVRGWFSIPLLTLLAAGAAAIAQFLIAMGANSLGLSSDAIAVPAWFRVLVALYVVLWFGAFALIMGGVAGWATYFGAFSGSTGTKAMMSLMGALIIGYVALGLFYVCMLQVYSTATGWRGQLEDGQTPGMISDFVYRACLESVPGDTGVEDTALPSIPVVLVNGDGGVMWIWTSSHEDEVHAFTEIRSIHASSVHVHRIPDRIPHEEASCPETSL